MFFHISPTLLQNQFVVGICGHQTIDVIAYSALIKQDREQIVRLNHLLYQLIHHLVRYVRYNASTCQIGMENPTHVNTIQLMDFNLLFVMLKGVATVPCVVCYPKAAVSTLYKPAVHSVNIFV